MQLYIIIGAAIFWALSLGAAYFEGRSDGRAKISAEWEADKATRIKRTTDIILQQQGLNDRLSESLRQERSSHEAKIAALASRAPIVLGNTGRCPVAADAVRLFNDTVRGDQAPAPAAQGTAPAADATVADLYSVCVQNVERHLACVDQVLGWQRWWDGVSKSYGKDILNDLH